MIPTLDIIADITILEICWRLTRGEDPLASYDKNKLVQKVVDELGLKCYDRVSITCTTKSGRIPLPEGGWYSNPYNKLIVRFSYSPWVRQPIFGVRSHGMGFWSHYPPESAEWMTLGMIRYVWSILQDNKVLKNLHIEIEEKDWTPSSKGIHFTIDDLLKERMGLVSD